MTNQTAFQNIIQSIANKFDKFEPLSISTLIFLMIGGVHQVLNLYTIGYKYLRFFSVTQLLSDSIAILLLFLLFVLAPISCGFLFGKIANRIIDNYPQFLYFYIFIFLCFNCYTIYNEDYYISIIASVFSQGFLLYLVFFGVIQFLSYEKFAKLIFVIVALIPICGSIYAASDYHRTKNNFNLEIENFDKIHNMYNAKNIKSNILYFNDNYIFVEIKKDSLKPGTKKNEIIRKIEILKFDKFFE
jgi:hypothetical protein